MKVQDITKFRKKGKKIPLNSYIVVDLKGLETKDGISLDFKGIKLKDFLKFLDDRYKKKRKVHK